MNDTLVTLVGNAATGVTFRDTATGGMSRFRFAVTARRWDREKQFWADGHTSFYTVFAWRALAANLPSSVAVGEPLIVHGRLKVREEERDGQRKTFVDVEAISVGHDLTRGTAAFRRVVKADSGLLTRAAEPAEDQWTRHVAQREHGVTGHRGARGAERAERAGMGEGEGGGSAEGDVDRVMETVS
ncbi:single-stranded DNA-binding protein [Streptomyces sp. DT24]|uniref:single-stranded DNA-binding protein n=1 Tax=Streptomyces sp. DT24 TaxID=3416520 RepID=UPI003CE8C2C0